MLVFCPELNVNPHMHKIIFATLLYEMSPQGLTKGNAQLIRLVIIIQNQTRLLFNKENTEV